MAVSVRIARRLLGEVVCAELLHEAAETVEPLEQMNPVAQHLCLGDETSAFLARLLVAETLVFRETHRTILLARCAACKTKFTCRVFEL